MTFSIVAFATSSTFAETLAGFLRSFRFEFRILELLLAVRSHFVRWARDVP